MSLMNLGWEIDSMSSGIVSCTTPILKPCKILGYQITLSMAPLSLPLWGNRFCEILFSGWFTGGVSSNTNTFGPGASLNPTAPLHGGAGEGSMLVCSILKSGAGEGVNQALIRNFVNPIIVPSATTIRWQINYGGTPAVDFEMQGCIEFVDA